MRLLLDTQALIWWLAEPERLKPRPRSAINDHGNEVVVSIVSLWEIAIKHRIGKLQGEVAKILPALAEAHFQRIGIDDRHLLTLESLPLHHNDPFDRLLIAQAIAEELQFVTSDRKAKLYPVGILQC